MAECGALAQAMKTVPVKCRRLTNGD
jgi:hypothetical protein